MSIDLANLTKDSNNAAQAHMTLCVPKGCLRASSVIGASLGFTLGPCVDDSDHGFLIQAQTHLKKTYLFDRERREGESKREREHKQGSSR